MLIKILAWFPISFILISYSEAQERYITSHIHAQLGNQMFEIAAAIGYARDHGYEARFPEIRNNTQPIDLIVLHRLNICDFPSRTKLPFITYKERLNRYEPLPFLGGYNVYLDGYFQSEKYFYKHRDYIIDLFSPTEEVVQQIRRQFGYLLEKPTVAVHIRTFIPDGNNPALEGNWGEFDWNYFIKAIEYFSEDYLFLVFSDSMEWIKNNFPQVQRNCVFIEGNPAYIDLYLMSMCQHQIVSPRSSFSWWAAYLNRSPKKTVLAPANWINEDGIPESWIRITY